MAQVGVEHILKVKYITWYVRTGSIIFQTKLIITWTPDAIIILRTICTMKFELSFFQDTI